MRIAPNTGKRGEKRIESGGDLEARLHAGSSDHAELEKYTVLTAGTGSRRGRGSVQSPLCRSAERPRAEKICIEGVLRKMALDQFDRPWFLHAAVRAGRFHIPDEIINGCKAAAQGSSALFNELGPAEHDRDIVRVRMPLVRDANMP